MMFERSMLRVAVMVGVSLPALTACGAADGTTGATEERVGTQTSGLAADGGGVVPPNLGAVPPCALGCWAPAPNLVGLSCSTGCTIVSAQLQLVSTPCGYPLDHQETRLVVQISCPEGDGGTTSSTLNIPFGMQGAVICTGGGTVTSTTNILPEDVVALYKRLVQTEYNLNGGVAAGDVTYYGPGASTGFLGLLGGGPVGMTCRDVAQTIYTGATPPSPPTTQCTGISGYQLSCCTCCESSGGTGYNSYTNPLWFNSCSCGGTPTGTCSSP